MTERLDPSTPASEPRMIEVASWPSYGEGEPAARLREQEEWYHDQELQDLGDFHALVRWRRKNLRRYPDDPAATRADLGEALLLAGKPRKALTVLREAYRLDPSWPETPPLLLEALFRTGKDETAIEWREPPWVARLDDETLDRCRRAIEGSEDGVQSIWDLWVMLCAADHLLFDQGDLLELLDDQPEFVVEREEDHQAWITLAAPSPA